VINLELQFNLSLIEPNDSLVIATSGGVDSMVLLHYLKTIQSKYSLTLYVAHMNHHKRETSTSDQVFVEKYASLWGLSYQSFDYVKTSELNFHHDARMQRMNRFYEYAKAVCATKIVFAHHLDDQAETILMRLTRGSSFKGYAGIQEQSSYKDLLIIHPLLHETKENIYSYQIEHGIEFVEDESNQKDDYTRNRYRHQMIPFLKAENPKALEKFDQFSQIMNEAYQLIEQLAKTYMSKSVVKKDNKILLALPSFTELETILQKEVIKTCVNHMSNNQTELSSVNTDFILSMVYSQKPNMNLRVDEHLFVTKSYDLLYFEQNKHQASDYSFELLTFGEVLLPNNDKIIISQNPCNYDGKTTILWYNNLDFIFPITIRNRRKKDTLVYDFGSKKLKDVFIDKKIPMLARNQLPIILNKSNEIICIPGIYQAKTSDTNINLYIHYLKGINPC
jgi:tRNA(Ile)-lysidine synthetase-like protein